MKEKPIIVMLDNEQRRILTFVAEEFNDLTNGRTQIEIFEDDYSAAEFVEKHAANVVGYLQDINRPTFLQDGGRHAPAGIRFYNVIIRQLTPLAKTVFWSGSLISVGQDFELPVVEPDKIRVVEKPSSIADLIECLEWLTSPSSHKTDEKEYPDRDTSKLIQLLYPPWEEVCKYLADHPQYLHQMNPRKFEMLVAEIFRSFGWDVELTAQTRDGGYDIVALKRVLPTNFRVLVEAKRWSPNKPVGVQVVRSLYGLRASQSFSKIVLATSTYVSGDAKREFERVIPWELDFIERDTILNWCKTYPEVVIRGSFDEAADGSFKA